MKLSLLAALADDGTIGVDGKLPWHLPDELRHVKRLTTGHTLVMGRKTYESIGRPLPQRRNIVVSRSPGFAPAGVEVATDFEAALALAASGDETETFVFGGASLYARALAQADCLYLTRVHTRGGGDVHFPAFEEEGDSLRAAGARWKCVAREEHPADERHAHAFTFEHWERA